MSTSAPPLARRLAVIGLGLIGGSLIHALVRAGVVTQVAAYDPDPSRRAAARASGVVDDVCDALAPAVAGADLIVIAVPVLRTAEVFAAVLAARDADAVVTDVGSTKQSVLADVASACGGELPAWFVPGHPIAGTERSGFENAVPHLFVAHRSVLTPCAHTCAQALSRVQGMWEACGARVAIMDARTHDEIFAATSHLPHLLAYSFVDTVSRFDRDGHIFSNAGGGFRDFTRIASSSPQMWHDIIRANSASVLALLDCQLEQLQQARRCIAEGHWDQLKLIFERARAARERYLNLIE